MNKCFVCNNESSENILDLGLSPIANNLEPDIIKSQNAKKYPLNLSVCRSNCNHVQISEIIDQKELASRWRSFGWNVIEVDGHNYDSIHNGFTKKRNSNYPNLILANTIKGKGINFMENNNEWHHGRLTETLYNQALEEL